MVGVKERPILFSAPMVRAILDGHKTQTRRIVKPQPPSWCVAPVLEKGWWMWQRFVADRRHFDGRTTEKTWDSLCPYGQPGDRLWVRETWKAWDYSIDGTVAIQYSAGGDDLHIIPPARPRGLHDKPKKWRPSIFMLRWASRITLEVTGVRVERLQDISEGDAINEGIPPLVPGFQGSGGWARDRFAMLWDSINAKRAPWSSNPWVWVIEFKRLP